MDGPIISIYDMLVKRHRQQKKAEQIEMQKELSTGSTAAPSNLSRISGEPRKTKGKISRTRISGESKEKQVPKMSCSAVTATHLTKKHTGIMMPPLTKKEVLDQLIERMSNPRKKPKEETIYNESSGQGTSPVDDESDEPIISIKKMKTKPKNLKTIPPGSASSQSRRRLVLSPRNTNTLGAPKAKREKPIKPKTVSITKSLKPDPDKRIRSKKSKLSIISKKDAQKTPSDENVICYRL